MKKPQLLDIISNLSPDAFAYFFPGARMPEIPGVPDVVQDDVPHIAYDGEVRFRITENDGSDYLKETACKRITLDVYPKKIVKHKIKRAKVREKRISILDEGLETLRSIVREPAVKHHQLDPKTQALLEEIKALQEKYGVSIDELEAVLSYTVKISRLRITRHHEIILEDFDKREVKMVPLTKAIFLLYLAHPEGIRFKDLGDYRQELEKIYMSISGRSDLQAMKKSIDRLTNSVTSNSINEKVSKVSKAFREVVDDRIARFYYIEGKSGEPKRIALDRSLVIWD